MQVFLKQNVPSVQKKFQNSKKHKAQCRNEQLCDFISLNK